MSGILSLVSVRMSPLENGEGLVPRVPFVPPPRKGVIWCRAPDAFVDKGFCFDVVPPAAVWCGPSVAESLFVLPAMPRLLQSVVQFSVVRVFPGVPKALLRFFAVRCVWGAVSLSLSRLGVRDLRAAAVGRRLFSPWNLLLFRKHSAKWCDGAKPSFWEMLYPVLPLSVAGEALVSVPLPPQPLWEGALLSLWEVVDSVDRVLLRQVEQSLGRSVGLFVVTWNWLVRPLFVFVSPLPLAESLWESLKVEDARLASAARELPLNPPFGWVVDAPALRYVAAPISVVGASRLSLVRSVVSVCPRPVCLEGGVEGAVDC